LTLGISNDQLVKLNDNCKAAALRSAKCLRYATFLLNLRVLSSNSKLLYIQTLKYALISRDYFDLKWIFKLN